MTKMLMVSGENHCLF